MVRNENYAVGGLEYLREAEVVESLPQVERVE
jgi:hypothetical protein